MASLDHIREFAKEISQEAFGLVVHEPQVGAEPMMSFANVQRRIERDGGRDVFGWVFQSKTSEFGEYVVALHHAIWWEPDGRFIDITPYSADLASNPVSDTGRTYFLIDGDATPISIEGGIRIALPSKFHPLTNRPELLAHIEELRHGSVFIEDLCLPQR